MDKPTVKAQLDTTLNLFEDVSETIGRLEERLIDLEIKISKLTIKPAVSDSSTISSISSDAADLRTLLISLRQQLDKSFATDIEPMTGSLKYLHHDGIPALMKQTTELSATLTALQQSIPLLQESVNAVVANTAPLRADTAAAGKFARDFQLPMQELTGRNSEGFYEEGTFALRNMARTIFFWAGRDEVGRVKEGSIHDRMDALLLTFFEKNYLRKDGTKMSRWEKIGESFLDYVVKNFWHRVFDVILLAMIWVWILNPSVKIIRDLREPSIIETAHPTIIPIGK